MLQCTSHIPCKLDCQKTLFLADRILDLYKIYSLSLAKKITASLKNPVLIFKLNNYIRFNEQLENDSINYSSIDYLTPFSIERGYGTLEDRKIEKVINLIKTGNKIEFKQDKFIIFKNNKEIFVNFLTDQLYQFYNSR